MLRCGLVEFWATRGLVVSLRPNLGWQFTDQQKMTHSGGLPKKRP